MRLLRNHTRGWLASGKPGPWATKIIGNPILRVRQCWPCLCRSGLCGVWSPDQPWEGQHFYLTSSVHSQESAHPCCALRNRGQCAPSPISRRTRRVRVNSPGTLKTHKTPTKTAQVTILKIKQFLKWHAKLSIGYFNRCDAVWGHRGSNENPTYRFYTEY